MLKITNTADGPLQKWTLQGQLAGPWVDELQGSWDRAGKPAKSVVDLTDVTFIDEAGAKVLCAMKEGGVKFIAAGVDTKYLLDDLKRKTEPPLRRCLSFLTCCSADRKEETNK